MADHTLEAKIQRRREETDEIEKTNDENLIFLLEAKTRAEEEISNLSSDDAMKAHIVKLKNSVQEAQGLEA